jgi:hypothetical protein
MDEKVDKQKVTRTGYIKLYEGMGQIRVHIIRTIEHDASDVFESKIQLLDEIPLEPNKALIKHRRINVKPKEGEGYTKNTPITNAFVDDLQASFFDKHPELQTYDHECYNKLLDRYNEAKAVEPGVKKNKTRGDSGDGGDEYAHLDFNERGVSNHFDP